jgi:hypothetical protein
MARSISIVEYKVEQARFFLEQIAQPDLNFFAVQCFADAFASTCRTITFSMQAVIGEVDGFKEWHTAQMEMLKKDRLSQFFNAYRIALIHIGDTVVREGTTFTDHNGKRRTQYLFAPIPDLPDVPDEDVVSACTSYFIKLLNLVYEAFATFCCQLDDRWYYTEENFRRMGKSFEDAVAELGFPRGWAAAASQFPEAEKWRVLRRSQTVGCQLNDAFQSYLSKIIRGLDDVSEQNGIQDEE